MACGTVCSELAQGADHLVAPRACQSGRAGWRRCVWQEVSNAASLGLSLGVQATKNGSTQRTMRPTNTLSVRTKKRCLSFYRSNWAFCGTLIVQGMAGRPHLAIRPSLYTINPYVPKNGVLLLKNLSGPFVGHSESCRVWLDMAGPWQSLRRGLAGPAYQAHSSDSTIQHTIRAYQSTM